MLYLRIYSANLLRIKPFSTESRYVLLNPDGAIAILPSIKFRVLRAIAVLGNPKFGVFRIDVLHLEAIAVLLNL